MLESPVAVCDVPERRLGFTDMLLSRSRPDYPGEVRMSWRTHACLGSEAFAVDEAATSILSRAHSDITLKAGEERVIAKGEPASVDVGTPITEEDKDPTLRSGRKL